MKTIPTLFFLFIFMAGLGLHVEAQCEIGEIEATPTECDSSGYFDMVINFEYTNTGSQGFTIQGNGIQYGTYEYEDLPVIIYDLYGDGQTFYEFVVIDVEFPACSNYIDFGTVDCFGSECNIWNVDVFPQPCEDGFFYVELGFWYENVGESGFRIQGNGNNYGNFQYDDLPVSIGPLEGDGITEYEFVVIDNDIEGCSDWAAIDPVDCNGGGSDCEIGELIIDDHPCDSNGMFYVYLDFEFANVGDSGFVLYVNDDLFGYYFYDELPLENLGPFEGDGTTVYHFLVRDADTYDCAEDKDFGPIECGTGGECDIWDLVADDHPCDNGMFTVFLDFEYEHTSDWFDIYVNGEFLNEYPYSELPLENVGPFLGDDSTVYHFLIKDGMYEGCAEDINLGPIDCMSQCEIGELEPMILPCDENGYFFVLLNFEYANTSESFNVQGNGMTYGNFPYTELPVEIGPLFADGMTFYEFAVIDAVYPDCAEDTYINPVTCDSITEFLNFTTTVISCTEGQYDLVIDFDVMNSSSQGFRLMGNGEDYGSNNYDELPVTIGPFSADGVTQYHFIARDMNEPVYGNYDKLAPFTCENLGVDENPEEPEVKVYPNPSNGSVTFENPFSQAVQIYIYGSTGALVSSFTLTGSHQQNDLNNGVYFYSVVKDGQVLPGGKLLVH